MFCAFPGWASCLGVLQKASIPIKRPHYIMKLLPIIFIYIYISIYTEIDRYAMLAATHAGKCHQHKGNKSGTGHLNFSGDRGAGVPWAEHWAAVKWNPAKAREYLAVGQS